MASKRPQGRAPARRPSAPRRPAKPAAPRKRRTPEEARDAILQAAEPLLVEQGPDKVGLQAVAKAAGVSHALVTHYFGTYEALVREVLLRRNELLAASFREHLLAADAPPSAGALLERFFTVVQQGQHSRLMAWALLTGRAEHMPLVRAQGLRLLADALEFQSGRVAEAQGTPPPSRDTVDMTLLVALCASQWFLLAREVLLPVMGRPADAASDARFREVLGGMLQGALGMKPPGGG
ncbi:TetR/AcrR family transcriptional regulator [Corallococcus exiguus]|uniref:TetR/AcrR family transcriptional regulator n=1 Tax=Corallococcus TaxID=83461 RepID=UPI000EB8A473|nr:MULTISPECIES: TetR/AcrR family transcriptional regulator [Corallococcus]NNC00309.1 TetR/AcrR family transcriptional regulator [Corallococcus exiguus]NPC53277.1 TetR/AcrR family transcriptional regulator [Corallococcus exiguus]RKH87061.1 TetR/AcrR family transcriptional regulator [Corallococcus sp. AB032C]